MFQKRHPQRDLFVVSNLLPPAKAARVEKSWATVFRDRALPLIDEEQFAHLYHADNGRPNRAVQTVFGVLLLKEMFGLTDVEALEQLEFHLLWQHALDVTLEEAHLPQKTLHNFRARLLADDQGQAAFRETTDRILAVLGTKVTQQRLDSTHVLSNIAHLSRLGLFCETVQVFLVALRKKHPELYEKVPKGVLGRYVKDDGQVSQYGDARAEQGRRRLPVCARDLYRLHELFRSTAAAELPSFGLLRRLLEEQCTVKVGPQAPDPDEDDTGEAPVPVGLKARHHISSASLQSPHDPDVTYSGHKGKGYELQISETCAAENETQILTHVAVTPSCGSDAQATLPVLGALAACGQQPEVLVADTSYGSAENAVDADEMGTELVSPVGGSPAAGKARTALTGEDFEVDAQDARCPAGHAAQVQQPQAPRADGKPSYRVTLGFSKSTCTTCPLRSWCPVQWDERTQLNLVTVDRLGINRARRRRAQLRAEFQKRYAIRAGIEATNSEMKRAHDLGHLRVRGRPRVVLAVHLKALACNLKRMLRALLARMMGPRLAVA